MRVDCIVCSKKKFPIIVEVNHGYIAIHRSGSGQLSQGWKISRSRPGYINYIIWEIERIGGEFLQEVLIGNTLKHNFQR